LPYSRLTVPAGDFDVIFAALEKAHVRYLVVGGVAVVLHGHLRFTADIDLVLSLDAENLRAALAAFKTLGYQPRAPIPIDDFLDPAARQEWVREKNLTVFSLWSPTYPATSVDLFVEEPFPFNDAASRATVVQLGGVAVSVASISDLVAMKARAGRPQDLEDIKALQALDGDSDG
jgi:Nucleotidyl transferase AbiEii toxin, Type IV TA system